MTICPGTVLLVFMVSLWIIASWTLRQCERSIATYCKLVRYVHFNESNYRSRCMQKAFLPT
ncbi:unnamed protein product [Nesidiocoris tenuis]|uniref:Uncharacterized protein n=1 Tax=Nesidiocoris tenuis TaxID=355587 RepID=A0A6H5GF68_9HEMI|nr:unnamed protein product [Nesidiocoris tenuis]